MGAPYCWIGVRLRSSAKTAPRAHTAIVKIKEKRVKVTSAGQPAKKITITTSSGVIATGNPKSTKREEESQMHNPGEPPYTRIGIQLRFGSFWRSRSGYEVSEANKANWKTNKINKCRHEERRDSYSQVAT